MWTLAHMNAQSNIIHNCQKGGNISDHPLVMNGQNNVSYMKYYTVIVKNKAWMNLKNAWFRERN